MLSAAHHNLEIALPTGRLEIRAEAGDFALNSLCGFASRNNPKRGFLFVSKVLGKHYPADPTTIATLHDYLATRISRLALPGPMVFIAMAETATGLGHGIFERYLQLTRRTDSVFLHTTRYRMAAHEILDFEESHSHASDQFLHVPNESPLAERFNNATTLILIDDEISTGNTFVNLVQAYINKNPESTRICLVSLTDFLGAEKRSSIQRRIKLSCDWVSALRGEYSFSPDHKAITTQQMSANGNRQIKNALLPANYGRLGLGCALNFTWPDPLQLLGTIPPGSKILVLGTGEFMHPPYRLAAWLAEMGHTVSVQSTTRSPIRLGFDIDSAIKLRDNYGDDIPNYLYNVAAGVYERVLLCHETPPCAELHTLARRLHATLIRFEHEKIIVS